MLSGKILQPADWLRLFQAILDAPIVEEAVLTVVSDEVSGSIGVRQGRWIMGASTSTGLKGAAAVRQLISLPHAQFGYLDAQKVKVRASIDQQLQVDIGALLNDPSTPIVDTAGTGVQQQHQPLPPSIPAPRPLHGPAATSPPKPQTPAEVATAELRKTFNQLRPVPSYYHSQVPPPPPPTGPGTGNLPKAGQSGIRPAIPAPPKVVSPPAKKSQSYNPWGGDESDEQEPGSALNAQNRVESSRGSLPSGAAQSPQPMGAEPAQPQAQSAQDQSGRTAFPQERPVQSPQHQFPQHQFPQHQSPEPPGSRPPERVAGEQLTAQDPPGPGDHAQGGPSFEFDPTNIPNESGAGRKRVNPLDKLIYGAASTCMKLTSLKAREKEQQQEAAAQQQLQQQQLQQQQLQQLQQQQQPGDWSPSNPWGTDEGVQPQQLGKPWGAFAQLMPGQQPAQSPSQQPSPLQSPHNSEHPLPQQWQSSSQQFPTHPAQQDPQQPSTQQWQGPQQSPTHPSQQDSQQPSTQQWQSPQQPQQQPQQHPQQHPQQASPMPQGPQGPGGQHNFAPQAEHYPDSPASPAPGSESGYVHPLEQYRRSQPYEARKRAPEQPDPPPPRPAVEPVAPQPHPHVATVMPHMVAPPLDPAEARNMVDAVRATAWRLASRVAYEAKLRMEEEHEKNSAQRLRTIEHATTTVTENAKARRGLWPPDATTIAFGACILLGLGVLGGGFVLVQQQQGNAPYVNAAKRYLAQGRDDLAIPQLTLAIERDPQNADTIQLRAETYERMKDWEHASADYSRVWDLKPKHYDAARKAAFFQFKIRHYEDAEKLARKLLAARPDDASARALVVVSLARGGKCDEAVTEGAEVDNDLVPPYLVPDYFGSLGFAYGKTGQPKQAVLMYTKALEADAQNESSLSERAAAFMELKDYKKAAEDFKNLTKLFPARAGGHADYGKAAMLCGDAKTAAQQYEEAIKLSPSVQYYVQLAQADMAINNYGHAVYDCDCALKLQPTCFEAAHLRTEAMQKAKSGKAIVIAKITPDYVMQNNHAPGAIAAKLAAANVAVSGQDPLTQQGYKMLLSQNWKAASDILASAIKRTPRDWSARRFYAAANMEQGRYGDAMQSFDVMNANHAILASDQMAYGECAAKAGKAERALEIYNGCLNRDPTFLEARLAMIRLCVQKGFTAKAKALVKEGETMQPATKDTLHKALAGG